jgi:hypothetical protein
MKRALAFTVALVLGVASLALAAGGDDTRATEAILSGLEADPAHKAVTQDLVKRSRAALERATRMRAAGDESHARLSDGVARAWADAAQDLARAADAEAKASAARLAAIDAGAVSERERALLEEGIAHNGRLRSQLEQVDREKNEQPSRTSTVADAGAPQAPKKPAAPSGDAGANR